MAGSTSVAGDGYYSERRLAHRIAAQTTPHDRLLVFSWKQRTLEHMGLVSASVGHDRLADMPGRNEYPWRQQERA